MFFFSLPLSIVFLIIFFMYKDFSFFFLFLTFLSYLVLLLFLFFFHSSFSIFRFFIDINVTSDNIYILIAKYYFISFFILNFLKLANIFVKVEY